MGFNLFQSMNKFDMAYRFDGMIQSLLLLSKFSLPGISRRLLKNNDEKLFFHSKTNILPVTGNYIQTKGQST